MGDGGQKWLLLTNDNYHIDDTLVQRTAIALVFVHSGNVNYILAK